MHLILYDASCSICHQSILFVLKKDKKKRFRFSSLTGKTAQLLRYTLLIPEETLVLIEYYQTTRQTVHYRAKAVFKILWDLGGFWKGLGWMHILPSWLIDPAYRFFAKKRRKVCQTSSFKFSQTKGRFLP